LAAPLAAARLPLADAAHQVERVEQGAGNGYGPENPFLALFQGGEHQHTGGEPTRSAVSASASDSRHPAKATVNTDLAVGTLGLAAESVALGGGDIFAGAVAAVGICDELGAPTWPEVVDAVTGLRGELGLTQLLSG